MCGGGSGERAGGGQWSLGLGVLDASRVLVFPTCPPLVLGMQLATGLCHAMGSVISAPEGSALEADGFFFLG